MRLGGVVLAWEELMNVVFAGVVIGALAAVHHAHEARLGHAGGRPEPHAGARCSASTWRRLVTVTFVLNAALTAVAAILIAPMYLVKYDIGIGLGLKAFYAAIIGGFNQMRGALARAGSWWAWSRRSRPPTSLASSATRWCS